MGKVFLWFIYVYCIYIYIYMVFSPEICASGLSGHSDIYVNKEIFVYIYFTFKKHFVDMKMQLVVRTSKKL